MTAPVVELAPRRLKEAALSYVLRGWHVFPVFEMVRDRCACGDSTCGSPGKHPRTKRGHLDASTDGQQVARWWKDHPSANIGIATGPSGLVVLDIDPRNGGDEALAAMLIREGELPDTVRALTGGKGEHYYFSRPLGVVALRSRRIGRGVEVKADGGYVVAAPSNHLLGMYSWDAGADPSETPIAILPPWIRVRAERKASAREPSLSGARDGLLGAAFTAAGMVGKSLGTDKLSVLCPWRSEHTTGKDYDSSTIVFAPAPGFRMGWFHCSHSHCADRTQTDTLSMLPAPAVTAAKKVLEIDPDWQPNPDGVEPPTPTEPVTEKSLDTESAWRIASAGLRWNSRGELTRDPGNAAILLGHHPEWAEALVYDEMADRIYWRKPPPEVPGLLGPHDGDEYLEHHWLYIAQWFARRRNVTFGEGAIATSVVAAARNRAFHPLRDYLTGLSWDGHERLKSWLADYLTCEPTPYASAVGKMWMISAVARAYEPGCQADHTLILQGIQGCGKSTTARILGGPWYLADLPLLDSKDAMQSVAENWLIEIPELDAFGRASSSKVKAFLTQTIDSYRPPYARLTVRKPRGCVFLGTTNESAFLRDASGARRFWPVRMKKLLRGYLELDRDHLWAEAVHWYRMGTAWHPTEADELPALIRAEQEERFEIDVWEDRVASWAKDRVGFTLSEALGGACLVDLAKQDRRAQQRMTAILHRLKFERKKTRAGESRPMLYFPVEEEPSR